MKIEFCKVIVIVRQEIIRHANSGYVSIMKGINSIIQVNKCLFSK